MTGSKDAERRKAIEAVESSFCTMSQILIFVSGTRFRCGDLSVTLRYPAKITEVLVLIPNLRSFTGFKANIRFFAALCREALYKSCVSIPCVLRHK